MVTDFRILARRTEKIENFLRSLYGSTSTVNEADAVEPSNSSLPQAQAATGLQETIHEGLPDNTMWDNSFQDAFSAQEPANGLQQLSRATLSNLPNNTAVQAMGGDDLVFQAPVFPFNNDMLANNPVADSQNNRVGDVLLPSEAAEDPAEGRATRSSSPSDTDHEAALALEVRVPNACSRTMPALTPTYNSGHGSQSTSCPTQNVVGWHTGLRISSTSPAIPWTACVPTERSFGLAPYSSAVAAASEHANVSQRLRTEVCQRSTYLSRTFS